MNLSENPGENMEIEDSFDPLFKDWGLESTDWLLPLARKCISVSRNEKEVLRALEISLCVCLKKFNAHDLEEEVFRVACLAAKNIVIEKLSHLEKNPAGCMESVNVFLTVMSYFERSFEYLNNFSKIPIIEVKSLLIATSEILHSCFSHCKISEKVYGSLFDSLTETLSNFFKKCCSLQEQMLQILTEKIECLIEDERQVTLFGEVMSTLSKLGIALINLEVKTMAKVWKVFAFLMEKHLYCLKNNFSISETIKNLCSSILSNMEGVFFKEQQELSKMIKLNCFLLKLVIKFSEVFIESLQNCQNSLLNLLLVLCKYDVALELEGNLKVNENHNLLNQLTVGANPLLSQIITDVGFVSELASVCREPDKIIEFVVLCCWVLKKLTDCEAATRSLWLNENENILKWIFHSASSGRFIAHPDINLPNILINGKQKRFTDLYEYVLVTTSAFLMTASAEEYCIIEKTLMENILQQNPIRAVLAIDIWCLLARFADSELCFTQILSLGKIFQEFHPQTVRVEKCYLASLIQRLFPLLTKSQRNAFFKSFKPSFHSSLWEGTGVDELAPDEVCDVCQALLGQVEQLLDQDESSHQMGISTGRERVLYEKFGRKIGKMWKFNCEMLTSTSESLRFLKIASILTGCVAADLPSDDLLLVLSQMKKLLGLGQSSCVKLFFTWILNSLSAVRVPPGPSQQRILTALADVFRELLSSKEVLAKEKALEAFYSFAHVTSHSEVVSMSVANSPQLKLEVADYLKRKAPPGGEGSSDPNESLRALHGFEFVHSCPGRGGPMGGHPVKKIRLDHSKVEEMLARWKEDGKAILEVFHSLSEPQKREIKSVCDSILSGPSQTYPP